jgi:hypothetical protein
VENPHERLGIDGHRDRRDGVARLLGPVDDARDLPGETGAVVLVLSGRGALDGFEYGFHGFLHDQALGFRL